MPVHILTLLGCVHVGNEPSDILAEDLGSIVHTLDGHKHLAERVTRDDKHLEFTGQASTILNTMGFDNFRGG